MASDSAEAVKSEHTSPSAMASESPSLKRRHSNQIEEADQKRQRIDISDSDDFEAFLEQTAASVVKQHLGTPVIEEPRSQNTVETPITHQYWNPYLQMRLSSLPILENLSFQILLAIAAKGEYLEIVRMVTNKDSDMGQAFATLLGLFKQTKEMYSENKSVETEFLSADELNIQHAKDREIIRITNLASFMTCVLGTNTTSLSDLHERFLDCFVPEGSPLKTECAELYLNFKTQMYISSISEEFQEHSKEDIVDELFPENINDVLMKRHRHTPLSDFERHFVSSLNDRRQYLLKLPNAVDSVQSLSEEFSWTVFLMDLISFLKKEYAQNTAPHTNPSIPATAPYQSHHQNSHGTYSQSNGSDKVVEEDSVEAKANRAAQELYQSLNPGSVKQEQDSGLQHEQAPNTTNGSAQTQGDTISQTGQPESIVKAWLQVRQLSASKPNAIIPKRPGMPSQRRPWTGEEELALMTGIDACQGPHWSKISAMYGPEGTISTVLKDRTQIQLKDKARNLKLYFLKHGTFVPPYLRGVTGDLKSRAPKSAARKDAEELEAREVQAKAEGIKTLASGLQLLSQGNGEGASPMSRTASSESGISEVLHVVEPEEHHRPSTPRKMTEDEQLAQALMAAS